MNGGADRFKAIMRKHRLHDTVPVSLWPLLEPYRVRQLPFSPNTRGVTIGVVIAVNKSLHLYEQRMVIAHELAHRILGHPPTLRLKRDDTWWYSRLELEAQQGAAFLLVPLKTLVTEAAHGATLRELSDLFEVPEELVQLRLRMARIAC